MKVLFGFIIFFAILNAFAADSEILLLQDKETDELILVKNGLLEKALEKPTDDELSEIDNDFTLPDWVVAEVRGGGSIMVLRGGAAVGVQTLGGHLETGIDTGAMFIMAGTDGAIAPELGAYVKFRLNPDKDRTIYFRGRVYKPFNISSDELNYSAGIGWERSSGQFIELTLDRFQNDDGDSFIFPFISMGHKFGGKEKRKEESIFQEEHDQ